MKNNKSVYLNFIFRFTNITLKAICKKHLIHYQNVYNGRTSENNLVIICEEIKQELENLLKDFPVNRKNEQ